MVGNFLGHYEILEPLGKGGMGDVYRAKDTNLDRDVAIKVLPEDFAEDTKRLARFEREAKFLASLNHPHIAAIYGLEEADGTCFIVMELVEGQTLEDRLSKGPLPVKEALETCQQIAEALEAAHEEGIIHRDLKPGNVVISSSNRVKVLDFGIAKAPEFEEGASASDKATALTTGGMVLGTVPYMSPEQVRGTSIDKRADIWAFGCVMYEALTGKRAFHRDTVADTLAAIIDQEPDWRSLPAKTPSTTDTLLHRCLEKDPHLRLHDIADARIELVDALNQYTRSLPAAIVPAAVPVEWRRAVPWGLIVLAIGVTIWSLVNRVPSTPLPVSRTSIDLSSTGRLDIWPYETEEVHHPFAVSPDGMRLAHVSESEGSTRLYLREMNAFDARPIAGTEGGRGPFFSPDGQWIGFFSADGKLKKVPVAGGPPITICDVSSQARGVEASWGPDDLIVFVPSPSAGLMRVSAEGGDPEELTTDLPGAGYALWPEVLPDGSAVLFTLATEGGPRIEVLSLETGRQETLVEGGLGSRYVPTGHLVYAQRGNEAWTSSAELLAIRFDPDQLSVTSRPVPVIDSVETFPAGAYFDISDTGTLVYRSGTGSPELALAWVDRRGNTTVPTERIGLYSFPRISRNGRHLALGTAPFVGPPWHIWIFDMELGTRNRLTFEGVNHFPVWSPDGQRVAFTSVREARQGIYWKSADGSGEAVLLVEREQPANPTSWSPDGDVLAFYEFAYTAERHHRDILMLLLEGSPTTLSWLVTPSDERAATFSPDGRWVAYVSDESGLDEVYVRPFRGLEGQWQVSAGGGSEPAWAPNGTELFYRDGNEMIVATIDSAPSFTVVKRELLFEGAYLGSRHRRNYDVHPDGERFLMVKVEGGSPPGQLQVVLNWSEELKRLVPTAQ